MSILQELEESLQSNAPSYMDFLYRYNPKKKQVFAFYEGDEDSSFYHHFLRAAIDDDCELEEIVAGCKNNIIKLQQEFDWNLYNFKKSLKFILHPEILRFSFAFLDTACFPARVIFQVVIPHSIIKNCPQLAVDRFQICL